MSQKDEDVAKEDLGMRRRSFLGLTGAAAGVALLEGCARQETEYIEQALKRGPASPGEPAWRGSVCQQCAGACDVNVRTIDGRAKKIEGEPDSPTNSGGVCALGHSALQQLYHPERLLEPRVRSSGGEAVAASWEQALARIAELDPRTMGEPGTVAFCCGDDPVEIAFVRRLAAEIQASVTIVEASPAGIERAARRRFYGQDVVLCHDLSEADFIFAVGASILDRWGNPVYFAQAVAESRARGVQFAVASQRMSLTAAKADLWVPLKGGPGPLLRGMLDMTESEGLDGSADAADAAATALAEQVGAPPEKIVQLARLLRQARRPAIIVGGEGAESTAEVVAGFSLQSRFNALPIAVRTEGLLTPPGRESADGEPLERTPKQLVEAVGNGAVQMIVDTGCDFLGWLPSSWNWAPENAAQDGRCALIALSAISTSTSHEAAVALPVQTDLESQQITLARFGVEQTVGGRWQVASPVVAARGSARQKLDVLAAVAMALGAEKQALPWSGVEALRSSTVEHSVDLAGKTVTSVLRASLRPGRGVLPIREELWQGVRVEPLDDSVGGGDRSGAASAPTSQSLAEADPATSPKPAASGASKGSQLQLHVFEGPRGEATPGQSPWLAELPDPLSSVMWGTWLEISPMDAGALNLSTGDGIEVVSSEGSIYTTVFVNPATRPGHVFAPAGSIVSDSGAQPQDARDLLGSEAVAGFPRTSVPVELTRGAEGEKTSPIFGRGLRRAEQIPAGWKGHSQPSSLPVVHDDDGAEEQS